MLEHGENRQKFVVGIDSGGTNYRVKAWDCLGNCLGYAVGKPANHHYLNQKEMLDQITENIMACLREFHGKMEDISCLVCGTTGMDSEEDRERLMHIYRQISGLSCPVYLMNDAELAHAAVTGGEGILLISGTGSIAVGRNQMGKTARAGGWPLAILGDEGSGTWVTKMALRHVGRWLDGAVEKTPLTDLICKELKIETRDHLIQMALESGINPAGLPQLGVFVNQAAEEGDDYAKEILIGAAEQLIALVCDVVYALDLKETEPDFKLGLWGSCILKSPVLRTHFLEKICSIYPEIRICFPKKEAIDGALEIALKNSVF